MAGSEFGNGKGLLCIDLGSQGAFQKKKSPVREEERN